VNTKLVKKGEDSKTTFILNALDQKKSEDPGSRTAAEFASAPHAAAAGSLTSRTGKSFVQSIAGVVHESGSLADGILVTRAYVAMRDLDNPAVGTWILIDRLQYGLGADYQVPATLLGTAARVAIGLELDQVKDERRARANTGGVIGSADTRNEDNLAVNVGAYVRADWLVREELSLTTGVRITQVKLQVQDHYFSETTPLDGSGSKTYTGVSPVIGLVRHLNPEQNLYVNIGQSFETPTLNEVLYTPDPGGTSINRFSGLDPAKSRQLEFGWKWRRADKGSITASAFVTRTADDIVPEYLSTSGSTWQNVDTERKGLEFAGQWRWNKNVASAASLTLLQATYRGAAIVRGTNGSTVRGGEKLPNIPSDRAQLELRYRSSDVARKGIPVIQSAVELVSVGKAYVRSDNTAKTSRYNLINIGLSANHAVGAGLLTGYVRIDNVTDKLYAASTIGDQAFARYFEPGAPRNWLLGLKYSVAL
jgi:iron complex outermembrane receptor protein